MLQLLGVSLAIIVLMHLQFFMTLFKTSFFASCVATMHRPPGDRCGDTHRDGVHACVDGRRRASPP